MRRFLWFLSQKTKMFTLRTAFFLFEAFPAAVRAAVQWEWCLGCESFHE